MAMEARGPSAAVGSDAAIDLRPGFACPFAEGRGGGPSVDAGAEGPGLSRRRGRRGEAGDGENGRSPAKHRRAPTASLRPGMLAGCGREIKKKGGSRGRRGRSRQAGSAPSSPRGRPRCRRFRRTWNAAPGGMDEVERHDGSEPAPGAPEGRVSDRSAPFLRHGRTSRRLTPVRPGGGQIAEPPDDHSRRRMAYCRVFS